VVVPASAEGFESCDFGVNVVGLDVEVHSLLGRLLVASELQENADLGVGQLEFPVDRAARLRQLFLGGVQGGGPETHARVEVVNVDHEVNKAAAMGHDASIKLAVLVGRVEFGPPKSAAGVRTVTLPVVARDVLRAHLARFTPADPEALIFTGAKGKHLRASTFGPAVRWRDVVTELGLPGFHFHDLRHIGNTLAAAAGASTRELMRRFGQSTTRAR
jgi:hypothetical protein